MYMIKDKLHNHTLELIPLDRKAEIRSCVACTQKIIDNTYYSCPEVGCNYFLHEYCGELPVKIKHGFHPHLLVLDPYEITCSLCVEKFEGFSYICDEDCSDFNLDLICATLADRTLQHHIHPHPLTLLRREIETLCNCCGLVHKGNFYHCATCAIFWIHQDCAALGPQVNAPNHPHPLTFVYSDSEYYRPKCDICRKPISNERSWSFQCVPCKFLSHVSCAMSVEKEEVEEIDPAIPRLPWEGCGEFEFGFLELINRKIATNHDVETEQMKICHFSHPEHELILHNEVFKVKDPYHGHQIPTSTKCNGCTTKISSPFYGCMDCDFFLHKCCAFLPGSVPQNPPHQEHDDVNLVQSRETWRAENVFYCDCCQEKCNGFSYKCEGENCDYQVDVECAFAPISIVHKAHPHLLTLTPAKAISFFRIRVHNCCERSGAVVYRCKKCDFSLHINCAMYPSKVSHRYDHVNPFKLWYDRGAVEANYFHCERCEQLMDPKKWCYHSKTSIGDQLLHPECILQREYHRSLKFKSTKNFIQVDIHPHRLHLAPARYEDGECHYCHLSLLWDKNSAYRCWEVDCDFKLHDSCAMELRETNSTGVEEYLNENS